MSDQQKIWFIYLTDHHEGPFTAMEIAEKAKAGLVSGQSLAWKDGMPEWVPAETIPELNIAMGGGAADAAPAVSGTLPGGGGSAPSLETSAPAPDGEVSLAQLLANQQQKGGETTVSGQISDSASVLSSMFGQVQKDNPVTSGSGVSVSGFTKQEQVPVAGEPSPEEEVWALKVGPQLSGLHSLNRLAELASSGEIPADAMVWHAGWTDFQPVNSVSSIASARKGGAGSSKSNTKSSMTKPGMMVSGMSNAAAAGDDYEPTDTAIQAPPKGLMGIFSKIFSALGRKNAGGKKAAPVKAAAAVAKAKATAAAMGGKKAAPKGGSALKRIATFFVFLILIGAGGGAAWFFLLSSPLPSDLDVSEDNRVAMENAVKTKQEEGGRLVLAQAKGSEDNPADPTSPKYYVATNLPEGTAVSLTVTGVPGTLVNRTAFEKTFTANVEKNHLAVFDQVKEDGKPLWGEFVVKISAEGASPIEEKGKFIGRKGGAYQNRLKQYKESVQAENDKEIEELREFIATLKSQQVESSKLIADYKTMWAVPASRVKVTADWAAFASKSQSFLSQVEQKLKDRIGGTNPPKYHARAFQDVSTTTGQLTQLLKAQSDRLAGSISAAGNADELDGLVQAGVQALEAWLAQAVSKSPFDTTQPVAPPTPASAAHAPVPATAPAPTPAPAPAAPRAE